MHTLIVITGAARGLGAALARATAGPGIQQLLVSRSASRLADVRAACDARGASARTLAVDLSDTASETPVADAMAGLDWETAGRATLFNNASQIAPIRHLEQLHASDIERLVSVNFNAAVWLSAMFLRQAAAHADLQAEVLNISTGVSLRPLAGWSLYCCSKAAVNLLAMSIAEETREWRHPVRAVALNPGPLDTDMQREIREAPDAFPDRARFLDLHATGRLASADIGARRILELRDSDPFPQGQFVDLKDRWPA